MTDWPAPEMVPTNGVTLGVYRMGPPPEASEKPPVFFLHGFPEIAYSWRAQMTAFAEAGHSVFAPDQRGYGVSDAPDGVAEYTMQKLTDDLRGLLDHYGIEKAVFVGHDWGAIVLWQLPFYMPDRVLGCAGLNVPLLPHYPMDPIAMFRMRFGDDMYIVRFQEEGACEPILERDLMQTFKFFLRKPNRGKVQKSDVPFEEKSLDLLGLLEKGEDAWGGEQLLSDEETAVYAKAYAKNGLTGPIHWYRNFTANWQDQKRFLEGGRLPHVNMPCLMITADLDRACPPAIAEPMADMCAPYERIDLKGCGHWSQQERADDVNAAIMDWVQRHFA
ncbi:alpha/beta fold hydrolase [Kordiimonas sp.]|uniref:alpha/beta fold hydrolase n=1 Tax=Kordiimonas sp. TaxID=1970157 RepID=UPI003A90AB55